MSTNNSGQNLWKGEELYKLLLNNSLAGVLVADIKTKKFLYANPAICKMLGYSSKELLKKSLKDIHPPDALKFVLSEFESQAKGEKELAPDVPFMTKNGDIIHCAVAANKGVVNGISFNIGTIINITEQKKAEMVLRDKEEQYRTFFENSTDAMLIIRDRTFVDCNLATVKMLGYDKKEEFLNTHPSELSPEFQPDGKKSYEKAIEMMETAVKKGAHHFEWDHKKKNGEVFPVEVSLTAIPSEGDITLHTVWRDISKRKQAEAEIMKMQKLKSIGSLAGGIAHDFNNILMGIFGNLSLAKLELDETHPAYEIIQETEKSIDRASRLSNQLLTFGKGGEPVKEVVKIGNLVKEVTLFTLAGSNVKPNLKEADGLWLAEVDEGQIQQVISNLVINSDKAMPDGGTLHITLENAEVGPKTVPHLDPGQYIKIIVKDEGKGISAEHLDRVFDPYFSTKQAGHGLGLAIVYSIVNKHHGHISVNSEMGCGTTFTVYLPASKSPASSKKTSPVCASLEDSHGSKILIMDDEEYIRNVTRKFLEKQNFIVETAAEGNQALTCYQAAFNSKLPFDLVLMDLTIPGGMGGKETIKKLLEIDPDAKVIVFSGYSTDPIIADFSSYGFKGRLIKPFAVADLLKEISRIIAG